jgi:hypothetical protein
MLAVKRDTPRIRNTACFVGTVEIATAILADLDDGKVIFTRDPHHEVIHALRPKRPPLADSELRLSRDDAAGVVMESDAIQPSLHDLVVARLLPFRMAWRMGMPVMPLITVIALANCTFVSVSTSCIR